MTRLESELTPQVVSLWYRPIELLLGQTAYGEGVDNWGCGCLLVELLEGEPAFRGRSEIDQLEKILNFRGKIDLDIWPACEELEGWRRVKGVGGVKEKEKERGEGKGGGAGERKDKKDLIDRLLDYNPKTRITAEEALKHEYFTSLPLPTAVEMMPTFS